MVAASAPVERVPPATGVTAPMLEIEADVLLVQPYVKVAEPPIEMGPLLVSVATGTAGGGTGAAATVIADHGLQLFPSVDSVMVPVSPIELLSAHARTYQVPAEVKV